MGCASTDVLQCEHTEREHQEREPTQRQKHILASPSLPLKMESPIQCDVDAHEAQTVEELVEQMTPLLGLEKADAKRLPLEFSGVVVTDRERTLHEIGMCALALFAVLDVVKIKQAKEEEARKRLGLTWEEARKVRGVGVVPLTRARAGGPSRGCPGGEDCGGAVCVRPFPGASARARQREPRCHLI